MKAIKDSLSRKFVIIVGVMEFYNKRAIVHSVKDIHEFKDADMMNQFIDFIEAGNYGPYDSYLVPSIYNGRIVYEEGAFDAIINFKL